MTKMLCIWHGNCQDGFGAAWAVHHALGEEAVEFYPGVYQNPAPDVTGRHVLFVDFSYKRPVIEEMAKTARSITILDHHASAADDLAGYPPPGFNYPPFGPVAKVTALFDMERSGAGLTWDFLHPNQPRPLLIDHIEDRDLWRFKLPYTREISAALFSYPYDFAVWDRLMDDSSHLVSEGEAIERKQAQDIRNLLPVVQRRMTIGGIDMPVANLPMTLTSDAGHKMAAAETGGVAACYWDTPQGRVFSLRSTELGPDCQAIAVQYGGGGHLHAAGFRMPIGWEGEAA
jgi:hypothetical protein